MERETFAWFDPRWRNDTFTCRRCRWAGRYDAMSTESFMDITQGACPKCDTLLLVANAPTEAEIEEAAGRGLPEAVELMRGVLLARERRRQFREERLTSPDQLPELAGDHLELRFDRVETEAGGQYIVTHGAREIWREPGFFEDWRRFLEIKQVVKARYGDRFVGLRVTPAASVYLLGEDPRAPNLDPD